MSKPQSKVPRTDVLRHDSSIAYCMGIGKLYASHEVLELELQKQSDIIEGMVNGQKQDQALIEKLELENQELEAQVKHMNDLYEIERNSREAWQNGSSKQ